MCFGEKTLSEKNKDKTVRSRGEFNPRGPVSSSASVQPISIKTLYMKCYHHMLQVKKMVPRAAKHIAQFHQMVSSGPGISNPHKRVYVSLGNDWDIECSICLAICQAICQAIAQRSR